MTWRALSGRPWVKATEEIGRTLNSLQEQVRRGEAIADDNNVLVQQLRHSYSSSNALQCPM